MVVYLFDQRGNNYIKLVITNSQSSSNKPSISGLFCWDLCFSPLPTWVVEDYNYTASLSNNFTDILTLLKNSFYNHRMLTSVSLGLQNSQLQLSIVDSEKVGSAVSSFSSQ